MIFEKRLDPVVASFFVSACVARSEIGVHRLQFIRKGVAKVVSESRSLRVIDIGAVNYIRVFCVVIEYQKAFVVRSDRGIHVIRQPKSFSAPVSGLMASEIGQHRVLSSRVDH